MSAQDQVNPACGRETSSRTARGVITRPALIPSFLEEAGALLERIERGVPGLDAPGSADVLRSLLRPLHTLKGALGLLGVTPLSGLAHDLESYLNFHGPGTEARRAVKEASLLFRELLTEIEMRPQSDMISDDLLERCENLRAGLGLHAAETPRFMREVLLSERQRSPGPAPATLARHDPVVAESLPGRSPARAQAGASTDLLRVEAGKVDRLFELLNEWEEAHATLAAAARGGMVSSSNLYRDLSRFHELAEQVRRAGQAIRLTNLRRSFQKVEWLVEDLAPRLGKRVELELHGAAVEVDIGIAQDIDTMLLHLARNALEHGIELPEDRSKQGKNPRGTLRLSAENFEEALVIELIDDGRGIDRESILAEAHARCLIEPEATATDTELLKLVFRPGFSTARTVTETAGRGLGLDIVRQTVEKRGGVLELSSDQGRGTTFQIYLPAPGGETAGLGGIGRPGCLEVTV